MIHPFYKPIGSDQGSQQKKNKNTACLIIEKETENKKEKCAAQSVTINSRIDWQYKNEEKHEQEAVFD